MTKNVVTLDCETTTRNKGNPFDPNNKLCSVGLLSDGSYYDFPIEYDSSPYGDSLTSIRAIVEQADLLVGFNIKFDIHWLRRYIENLSLPTLWDCQLGEYLLSNQIRIFPSLQDSCEANGLTGKLDIVKTEYWNKGIDTTNVPYQILQEYLEQDVRQTYALQRIQEAAFNEDGKLKRLFTLGNEDIKWLAEAEWNGMQYNMEESRRIASELHAERDLITCRLSELYDCPHLDWDSSDHISLVLFGGILYYTGRETYVKDLKAGPAERERNAWFPFELKPQLKPDKRNENLPLRKVDDIELDRMNEERMELRKKPLVRTYSVAEDILRSFKPKGKAKKTIDLLLRRSELTKLTSTYYDGIPKIMDEHDWGATLHGTFNKVGTRTGRISSSRPNMMNFAGLIKPLFESRYAAS